MREGLAKLEALATVDQEQALVWARTLYPQEEPIWAATEGWLKD